MIPIMTFAFKLWLLISIGFTMVNMSAKFDEETHNGLVCLGFTAYFCVHCNLDLWPLTSKINRAHPLTLANMAAKFDQEAHNDAVAIMFTSLFPYMSIVTLTYVLWPPKSIGFILSPWLTCLPSLIKKHTTFRVLTRILERRVPGLTTFENGESHQILVSPSESRSTWWVLTFYA